MSHHIYQQGFRLNAAYYTEVLETAVMQWIDILCTCRVCVFQQDSAPAHKAVVSQDWMAANLHYHITQKI